MGLGHGGGKKDKNNDEITLVQDTERLPWSNIWKPLWGFGYSNLPLFFPSEIRPKMGETDFTFGPITIFFLFILAFFPPRIRALQAKKINEIKSSKN